MDVLNRHDDEASHNTTGNGFGLLTVSQIIAYRRTRAELLTSIGAVAASEIAGERPPASVVREVERLTAALRNVDRLLEGHDEGVRAAGGPFG